MPKIGAKKAANLFQTYCFSCRWWRRLFSLSVKSEFHLTFYQLSYDVVLHIGIVLSVHTGEKADISGVTVKDGLYGCRIALPRLDNGFIGEKPIFHRGVSPFPSVAAVKQAGYAARRCFSSARTAR